MLCKVKSKRTQFERFVKYMWNNNFNLSGKQQLFNCTSKKLLPEVENRKNHAQSDVPMLHVTHNFVQHFTIASYLVSSAVAAANITITSNAKKMFHFIPFMLNPHLPNLLNILCSPLFLQRFRCRSLMLICVCSKSQNSVLFNCFHKTCFLFLPLCVLSCRAEKRCIINQSWVHCILDFPDQKCCSAVGCVQDECNMVRLPCCLAMETRMMRPCEHSRVRE